MKPLSQMTMEELRKEHAFRYVMEWAAWEIEHGSGVLAEWERKTKVELTEEQLELLSSMTHSEFCCYARETEQAISLHEDFDGYVMDASGECSDYDISHYDIDKALEEEFGHHVSTDSESGCFFSRWKRGVDADVRAFLASKFPSLKYSVKDSTDEIAAGDPWDEECYFFSGIPGFGNWHYGLDTAKELGVFNFVG